MIIKKIQINPILKNPKLKNPKNRKESGLFVLFLRRARAIIANLNDPGRNLAYQCVYFCTRSDILRV